MDPESLGLDRRAARIAGHPTHLLLAAVSDALREAGIAPGAGAGLEDASLEDEDTAFFAALDSVDPGGGDLVSAVQAMRHYEVTRYGTLAAWSKQLGHDKAAPLMAANLDEDAKADKALSKLAETHLNANAQVLAA